MPRSTKTVADFPKVVAQWHPTKNGDLTPEEVTSGSSKKYWWKCPKGSDHEWEAAAKARTGANKTGCPHCAGLKASVTNSLSSLFPGIAKQWHRTKNDDLTPKDVTSGSSKKYWWKCTKGSDHEWQTAPKDRTGNNKTGCPCCAGQKLSVTNSLATLFSEIADQWHRTKNDDLTPKDVTYGSRKKYWWKCTKGSDHEWEASPNSRTGGDGRSCPFCANQKVSVTNSLAKLFPDIASEWHPEKNGDLKPEQVIAGSNKKYWWKCEKGRDHEWPATAGNRTGDNKTGCPCCAGRQVCKDNSLTSLFPTIASEWHPEKNGDLKPEQVIAGSNKRYWWKCAKGRDHEWPATADSRTGGNKTGCPCCSGHKVSVTNSLAKLFPDIASEWHPEKNGNLTLEHVVAGSSKNFWWTCPKGPDHEWRATAANRTGDNKTACPCCAGQKLSVTNSLVTLFSEIADQWHRTKNKGVEPENVLTGTMTKYWWKCPEGPDHEWSATPADRTGEKKSGCPCCAGQKLSVTNSLVTLFSEIADQWHRTKNKGVEPENVLAGTMTKYWWKCPEGPDHEWKTPVVNRTRKANPTGCPYCRGLKVSVTNSLANCFPEIAAQWHRKKNGRLKPSQVVAGTHDTFWWKCSHGPDHEWQATPNSRTRKDGRGCPFCTIVPRSKIEIRIAFELSQFFEFEIDHHKLELDRVYDVDILIPHHKLIVEFDGSYWHREKHEPDTQKTAVLKEADWKVIRIRERPLKKIGQDDIFAPQSTKENQVKGIPDQLLPRIEKVCDIKIPKLAAYLKRKTLKNKKAADAYIEKLLAEKAAKK